MANNETNLFFGPLVRLRHRLAASPAFRALIGVTGSEAERNATALASAYCVGVDSPSSARPFAVIDSGSEFGATRNTTSSYTTGGSLWLLLEADVPTDQAAHADAAQWFYEILGNIIEDLMDDSITTTPADMNLYIRSVSLFDGPPARSDESDEQTDGDYYQAILSIMWGLA